MKRYRVLKVDFDLRVNTLQLEVKDEWEPEIQKLWRKNQENIKLGLVHEYGQLNSERKLKDFLDIGVAPFSILAFHNNFFRQIRRSFTIGAYYPALTAACALGERILNHLILTLRDSFKSTSEYAKVFRKDSFDNWDLAINTLTKWNVFRPEISKEYKTLRDIRQKSIHFRPEVDKNDRELALGAISSLSMIISEQFGGFGELPWFIKNTKGAAFIKKSFESEPFIRLIYLSSCVLVGPYHRMEAAENNQFKVIDEYSYENVEISDEEFAEMFNKGKPSEVPKP